RAQRLLVRVFFTKTRTSAPFHSTTRTRMQNEEYARKKISLLDALDFIRDGDNIVTAMAAAEPTAFYSALAERARNLRGVRPLGHTYGYQTLLFSSRIPQKRFEFT